MTPLICWGKVIQIFDFGEEVYMAECFVSRKLQLGKEKLLE